MVRRLKEDEKIARVKPVIGRLYHCAWAKKRGYVWKLVSFDADKDEANLITPKTRKPLKTQLSALRDTNKTLLRLEKEKKIKKYQSNKLDDNINIVSEPYNEIEPF